MPSIQEEADRLHAIEQARKDGEHNALLLAIHVVDLFIAKSETYEEFRFKWTVARGLYRECSE